MGYEYSPYIVPLVIAALVSGWVVLFAWINRSKPGAIPLALMALAITEWTIGYIVEISAPGLDNKVFWGKIEYIGIASVSLLWFIFAYQHSNLGKMLSVRNLVMLSVIPVITIGLAFTNELHRLVWSEVYVNRAENISSLGVNYGIWFWVHTAYSYLLLLSGAFIVIRLLIRNKGMFRAQGIALLVAVLAPWLGNALYLTGLNPFPFLDLTSFAFTVSLVAVVLGIYGFQLINLTPVARDILIEEMSDGMIVLDERNIVADANPSMQRMIGKPPNQIIGQPISNVLDKQMQLIDRFATTQDGTTEISVGEGDQRQWYELNFSSLYDKRKRHIGRVITAHDINDRKLAEEQKQAYLDDMKALQELHLELSQIDDLDTLYIRMIQRSQERLGIDRVQLFLLDEANHQIVNTYRIDQDGNIQDESHYREAITPDHWAEAVGNTPERIKLWEDAPLHDDHNVLVGSGWKAAAVLWNGHKSLGYLVCDNLLSRRPARPYQSDLVSILGTTFGHLIERMRAQADLALARDQAMEASRLKTQFLAKVSHELRTPLGGILGFAELLQLETFGPLAEKQKHATNRIIECTHNLTNMVNDLLDQSQIEAKSVTLRMGYFDMAEMLEDVHSNMSILAQEKGLAFPTSIAPDFPTSLYGDRQRLEQILVNLVGNAIKFTNEGQVSVKLSMLDPQHWAMQVSDTGIGIPKPAQAYIFEPFRQADNAISPKNRGTGLGLSIVKQLVELLDGQVYLDSDAGKGSTFSVILPIVQTQPVMELPVIDEG